MMHRVFYLAPLCFIIFLWRGHGRASSILSLELGGETTFQAGRAFFRWTIYFGEAFSMKMESMKPNKNVFRFYFWKKIWSKFNFVQDWAGCFIKACFNPCHWFSLWAAPRGSSRQGKCRRGRRDTSNHWCRKKALGEGSVKLHKCNLTLGEGSVKLN